MKSAIHFIAFILVSVALSAQSNVKISINHLLEGEEFAMNKAAVNNLENDFKVDRLEYYISGFEISHDGDQITTIDDLFVLVDLSNKTSPTEIDLGDFDISSIQSVSFHLGIEEELNHADPSLWPEGHPLAPKFPSMHWGWAAGYRFISLEGKSGPNINLDLQFHCIGDEFYQQIVIPVDMADEDNYVIEIDGNYENLLNDIDISPGMILHGNLGEIAVLASNMHNNVFELVESSVNTDDLESNNSLSLYPNPSNDGLINIDFDEKISDTKLIIYDQLGNKVLAKKYQNSLTVQLNSPGMYIASILDQSGMSLVSKKFIVR